MLAFDIESESRRHPNPVSITAYHTMRAARPYGRELTDRVRVCVGLLRGVYYSDGFDGEYA
eukprot:1883493-Rhodomonas_salina.1